MEVEQANRTLKTNIEGPGNKWDVRKRQKDRGTQDNGIGTKMEGRKDNEREKEGLSKRVVQRSGTSKRVDRR